MRKVLAILVLTIIIGVEGCKKTQPPKAIIYVVDEARKPVEGALVEIYSKPAGSIVHMEGTTDASGQVEFVTEQEYVLSAKAQKEIDGQLLTGTATVVFKYDETFEKTIVIK